MDCLQKLTRKGERMDGPFAGCDVPKVEVPGKTDLSDWVELMEVVEALCPVWPAQRPHGATKCRI